MKGNPLYILLWLSLILCFACSPGKKEKKYVIGVSQCSMTDIWRQSMIRDMEVEALNHPEIELVVMDAIQDNDTQISQIKGFIIHVFPSQRIRQFSITRRNPFHIFRGNRGIVQNKRQIPLLTFLYDSPQHLLLK